MNIKKLLIAILVFISSLLMTGCYIPPNEHVGKPAPHSYHQPLYYGGYYYP